MTTSLASRLGSGIKSIQRGVASPTGGTPLAVTITAVNTAKTELRLLGSASTNAYIQLTNSTTITVTSGSTQSVSWELTERY